MFLKSPVFFLLFFFISIINCKGQLAAFEFKKEKVPVGMFYQYAKSNIDGTHSSNTALYVLDPSTIISFKWNEGAPGGTLVKAHLDWNTFSVRTFKTYSLNQQAVQELRANLNTIPGNQLYVEVGDLIQDTIQLNYFPWQSYDFDFAGLSIIMLHRKDLEADTEFMITDFRMKNNQPTIGEMGMVKMHYLGKEEHHGFTCNKYSINGPGLENQGGFLWLEANAGFLVGFEIELPDEPGYDNGKLQLIDHQRMDPSKWEKFIKDRVH